MLGLERMSRCIAYYSKVEEIYLGTSSIPKRALSTPLDTEELRKALIKLYAGILRWLGSAANYYGSSSMGIPLRVTVKLSVRRLNPYRRPIHPELETRVIG